MHGRQVNYRLDSCKWELVKMWQLTVFVQHFVRWAQKNLGFHPLFFKFACLLFACCLDQIGSMPITQVWEFLRVSSWLAMLTCDITRTTAEVIDQQRWARPNWTVKSHSNKRETSVSVKPVIPGENPTSLRNPVGPHSCRGTSRRVFLAQRHSNSMLYNELHKDDFPFTRSYSLTAICHQVKPTLRLK